MNKKIIFIGVAILLLGLYSRAITVDGTCSSASVQCDLQINELTVCNDEPFTQTVFPSVSGPVSDWIRVLPESVLLEAGECQDLEVYTIAPCYQEPGNYSAAVTVNGTESVTKACSIDLSQGHFIDVEIVPQEQTITQCETAEYEIILSNDSTIPNQQEELVNLSIGGAQDFEVELENFQTTVRKGQEKTIELSLTPACTQELGDYEFSVKASLFNPNFFSTSNGTLTITQGQELEIEGSGSDDDSDDDSDGSNGDGLAGSGSGTENDPFIACIEKETSFPVKIKNSGNKADTLTIELDGPAWISASEQSIELEEGEEKTIRLVMDKTNAPAGEFEVKMTLTSEVFNFSAEQTFHVNLQDCFNASLEIKEGQENLCRQEENELSFVIKNDRINPLDLKLEVDGVEVQIPNSEISLDGMEEKEFAINIDTTKLSMEGMAQKKPVAIEIVFDASASMGQRIDKQEKIDIAKTAVIEFTKNISSVPLGLRVFGQEEGCGESVQLQEINENGIIEIPKKVLGLNPVGQTPLAQTLEKTITDFDGTTGEKFVILVSDGKESCNGNLNMVAQKLKENDITVYAIGFDIDTVGKKQLQKIVQQTGGKYYDATSAQELLLVFEEITKALDIERSKDSQKTLTVKLLNENFSVEKDFTLNVSDCHNVAMFVPQINVCSEIAGKDTITLTNIGTKTQDLTLEATPEFVTIKQDTITINPGETMQAEIEFLPQESDSEQELVIKATGENINISAFSQIKYLQRPDCVGFDLIELAPEIVGRIGEGERRKLLLVNLGKTEMEISLSSDKEWMYFEPEQVTLKEGEIGFANFYVTPPFDFDLLKEDEVAKITATNNFGETVEKETKLVVTGPSFGLVPQNIKITQASASQNESESGMDIEITFTLANESERTVEINSISTPGFGSSAVISKTILRQGDTTQVKVMIALGGKTGKIMIPLLISTTDGAVLREIEINVPEETEEESPTMPQQPSPQEPTDVLTGLVGFATLENIAIAIVVLLAIVLVVFLLTRTKEKETVLMETHTDDSQIKSIKEQIEQKAGQKTSAQTTSKTKLKKAQKKTVKKIKK